jgi:hypothetical protein
VCNRSIEALPILIFLKAGVSAMTSGSGYFLKGRGQRDDIRFRVANGFGIFAEVARQERRGGEGSEGGGEKGAAGSLHGCLGGER